MSNRSHSNSGHMMMNKKNRDGEGHSSDRASQMPDETHHCALVGDAVELLGELPDESVQLVVIDPPYNIDLADWDTYQDYLAWAKPWLKEVPRVLKPSGNFAVFGGLQFDEEGGDLLTLMHHIRNELPLDLVNLIIWYYKNGMSAHRFFANRHEEIAWFVKSSDYLFNLDAVREPYDEETKRRYLKDDRLNPETVHKGRNPTNVWEMNRLNGNAKERVGHDTQKPVEVIERLVKALSNPGDLVLDFFAGSGTTTRACVELDRHSLVCDTDPSLLGYLRKHLDQIASDQLEIDGVPHTVHENPDNWKELLELSGTATP